MCDYSLHLVSSRPAKVADKLVTMELARSKARGFAAVGELGTKLVVHDSPPELAVCLRPGTELAFDDDVQYDSAFSFNFFGASFGMGRVNHRVASFRQIDVNDPYVQHDALEFPNGQILKVNRLIPGQTVTVLQLPVAISHDDNEHEHEHVDAGSVARSHDSPLVLNRTSVGSGMASVLVPSEGAVMLWDTVRSTATRLRVALARSFQRVIAHKQQREAALPAGVVAGEIEAGFQNGMPVGTLPRKPAARTPAKKTKVKSAA
ncbi:conserved hypothetical protein [Nitrobacter hamburgensis X14]|uniref:Uncharacterized protein n=2 Tax=Nitrobacter hamburgensis TaxID=912 RepID=Q1QIC5_NITHX|nr:conserved hypothetical protein [Nitrobacter hamburgensis X14]